MRSPLCLVLTLVLAGTAGSLSAGGAGLDPDKALTQYGIDGWNGDQGLPHETVNAIAQTRDGYVWVGTYEGLARFDGVRFVTFGPGLTRGLEHDGIRALAVDSEGSLWAGTNGGGISRLTGGVFTHFSTRDGLPSDIVWAVRGEPRGGVWVGTNGGGLARFEGGRFRTWPTADSGEIVYALQPDGEGGVWVGTHGQGLRHLDAEGRWHRYGAAEGLPASSITSLALAPDGTLWVGTVGHGLWSRGGGRFRPFRPGLRNVAALLLDRAGSLWVGTNGGGVGRLADGRFEVLDTAGGLPDDAVYALFEDREGSVWVGTNGGGLARLRDGAFTTYTPREGLSDDFVHSVFEDSRGVVWAGTASGLDRLEGGRFVPQPGPPPRPVRSIAEDREGRLWGASYGKGVFVLSRDGALRQYGSTDGLGHDFVRAVAVDRAGRVWAATHDGLSRFDGRAWTTLHQADGLAKASLMAILEDREGSLWVGTDGGGLSRLRDGRFQTYTTRDGLASNLVLALHEGSDGALWVGTNAGLSLRQGERFVSFSSRSGLPSDSVSQVVDDGRGHLWVGTSRGVARLGRADLDRLANLEVRGVEPLLFGKPEGMRTAQCTAPAQPPGFRTRDGRLWFATTRGVAVLDPERLRLDLAPPTALVEEVLADRVALPAGEAFVVPAGTGRLEFHYTGLSLVAPGRVRFRFQLEGFDPDWVDASERRLAIYTGLRPGHYRFRVSAARLGGAWDPEGASVPVVVRPRFYQTAWFLLAVVAAAVVAGFGAHRLQVRRLRRREQELSSLVAERTRSLEEANALKKEVLEIAAHDLKNPLQVVQGYAELLDHDDLPAGQVRELARTIFRSARRMVSVIDLLLTHAALESGVLELSPEPTDLSALAASVVADDEPLARRKEQRIELRAGGPAVARVDPDRLREVVDNLVANAVKYGPRGSTVTVSVERVGERVRLTVADQGPGLTAEEAATLFQQYRRLSARPTGGERSTGLGLWIVKRLTEIHGGRVAVESEGPGTGSRFVIDLPGEPGGELPGSVR